MVWLTDHNRFSLGNRILGFKKYEILSNFALQRQVNFSQFWNFCIFFLSQHCVLLAHSSSSAFSYLFENHCMLMIFLKLLFNEKIKINGKYSTPFWNFWKCQTGTPPVDKSIRPLAKSPYLRNAARRSLNLGVKISGTN